MQTLKMLESILNKENKTTVNELQYEDKKLKDSIKNESMFLATGGKMNSGYKTFNKGMGKGLTVISDFSQTPKLQNNSEFDNPLYSMQEKYMSELNHNY